MAAVVRRVAAGGRAGGSALAAVSVAQHIALRLGLLKWRPHGDLRDGEQADRHAVRPPSLSELLLYGVGAGATFGGVYGLIRPLLPVPAHLAGAAYGIAAYLATYRLANRMLAWAGLRRVDVSRSDLAANVLLGVWLGEVERRLERVT